MLDRLRWLANRVLTPIARLFLRWGISPDVVTVAGTVGVVVAAWLLIPSGHLFLAAIVIIAMASADALDGTMARLARRSGSWGAFLDSTLDRIADGALFASLVVYFLRDGLQGMSNAYRVTGVVAALLCLWLGSVVPYARARAEALGASATVGIAERADRLALTLVAMAAVGLGAPEVVLIASLVILALASAVTVVQRMAVVYRQLGQGNLIS